MLKLVKDFAVKARVQALDQLDAVLANAEPRAHPKAPLSSPRSSSSNSSKSSASQAENIRGSRSRQTEDLGWGANSSPPGPITPTR